MTGNRCCLRLCVAVLIGVLCVTTALVGPARTAGGAAAEKATYKVDPIHSSIIFKVLHMGASHVWGRFNAFSGSAVIDEANPSASSLEFEIKTDSVDTGNAMRDGHLKKPDFFNASQFPTILFKAKNVKKSGEGAYEASGDLTLHGVTKPLTLKLERVGTGKGPRGGEVTGFDSSFAIKRSDYGMNFMIGPVSDEIGLTVSVECAKS
jgi:polyisoprenoid-binding protein YceI